VFSMRFRPALAFSIMLSLGIAGCGGDDAPPPASFPPLHYDYLTKLRLNVGSIDIQDHSVPLGPDDISAQSPVTPAQALLQIAHDRLFAAGLLGRAQFVIDQASIVRGAAGGFYGQMAVHLEVMTAGGQRAGYAEARVARQHQPGSDPENTQTVLYDMTKQMADAMNVELEYQIKRSMGDFLDTAASVPAAVTAAPLGPTPPPSVPSQPLAPPAPQGLDDLAPAPPDGAAPPADQPPPQMSPPPGYLQLPQGGPR
jgi:hypothetical protein